MKANNDWEQILNNNCRLEYDEEIGKYWKPPGQVIIHVPGFSISFSTLLKEDSCLIGFKKDGDNVIRYYFLWDSIVSLGFQEEYKEDA